MKKLLLAPIVILLFFISACGQEKDIDIQMLSSDLYQSIRFADELTLIDAAAVQKLYGIDNALDQYVYVSSGATAEEIAVFEFETKEISAAALPAAQERISSQKEDYASYMPEEIKRLENAIVKQTGRYLIVCVADGNKAAQIIQKYL